MDTVRRARTGRLHQEYCRFSRSDATLLPHGLLQDETGVKPCAEKRSIHRNEMAMTLNLDAYWMPYTGNRQFKKDPRMIEAAHGVWFTDGDGP